ncbi:RDD family protein [Gracilibacillus salinarum]|uniref:RDD family protein n=1 Tax=Gracilibacillus salinarum TaxID=2932255 RepID=A0ABY4GSG7_9BACI|nr:RDD family protein [Gracilibacillus salinarum]UOQ87219.1 RDD family protein [Gracilibacillus salinarum]
MTENQIEYASETTIHHRYAGFWMRLWAYLVDLIIVFSINGILLIPFKFVDNGFDLEIGFWTITSIISSIVFYLYFLLTTKFFNQTLGKVIFGLRVIREDHGPLSWSDLIFREVIGRFLHRVFPITILLYAFVAFTNQKQGIHDMIGNTRVVLDR